MAANSSLDLTSLDFDTLKQNLKTFLASQSTFKDYNFEGSNINVLLDVLAYNTYLNSFYLNMIGSESFMDTAQMRSSVVSRAKELNYTPRSARSSAGTVNITFETTGIQNTFEIPKGTMFVGTNANGNFVFTTDKSHIIYSSSDIFVANDITVYEGTYINETYVVDDTEDKQIFVLSNKNVDTTSLEVYVVENSGQTNTLFLPATSLYGLDSNSSIYFVQIGRAHV